MRNDEQQKLDNERAMEQGGRIEIPTHHSGFAVDYLGRTSFVVRP